MNDPTMDVKIIRNEFRKMLADPLEGCIVSLDKDDLFRWKIIMFGIPDTIYQGACFKLLMKFPSTFPMDPPKLQFLNEMWHPNVYRMEGDEDDGLVCISILSTTANEMTAWDSSECWKPSLTVRTILMSLVSLINEPNADSPANVDASKQYLEWQRNGTKDYVEKVRQMVEKTRWIAEEEGVTVPTTMEAFNAKTLSVDQCCKVQESDSDLSDEESSPRGNPQKS